MPQGMLFTTLLRKLVQVLVHLVYNDILWYLDSEIELQIRSYFSLCYPAHFLVFVLERISCRMSKLKIIDW